MGVEENNAIFNNLNVFPNPAADKTTFVYILNENQQIRLTIYDVTGRGINVLYNGKQGKGEYTISFEGRNLLAGVFYYSLKA